MECRGRGRKQQKIDLPKEIRKSVSRIFSILARPPQILLQAILLNDRPLVLPRYSHSPTTMNNQPVSSATTLTLLVTALALLVGGCCISYAQKRARRKKREERERKRQAKKSFAVNRRDLQKLARGEPTSRQRRRRHQRSITDVSASSSDGGWYQRISWLIPAWTSAASAQSSAKRRETSHRLNVNETANANVSEDGDTGLQNVTVMALDCEMVGAGRDGSISLLGRCSLVLLVQDEKGKDADGNDNNAGAIRVTTIYDKFVRPSKKVTDYRTPWSGITKDDLRGFGSLPCVPFEVCRDEVAALLASYEGKPVVLVGHALKNDFDVLNLRHPFGLTRDTATYRQFMKPGRSRNKMLQRKLSHLVEEELGMDIQSDGGGHSSVEDAEAALKLYWKVRNSWERSLGCPLRSFGAKNKDDVPELVKDHWSPVTLYLDGCNLPLGCRRNKRLINSGSNTNTDERDESVSWQIISKTSTQGTTEVYRQVDWIPVLRSALASASAPLFDQIKIMFDGAKYKGTKEEKVAKLVEVHPNLFIETTEVGIQVDDVLVERCGGIDRDLGGACRAHGPIVDIDDVVDALSNLTDMGFGALDITDNDKLDFYAVVRRNGGGTKTNKKLFEKLNLRRPEEGALCLSGLTARLQKNSLQTAKDLKRARVYDVVEYELRSRASVRNIIVTDDILLADRLVNDCGGDGQNMVLSWRQFQQVW